MPPGENKEQPFTLVVKLTDRLQNCGGGIGKRAAFATGNKREYVLVAEARGKGSMFTPTAKENLKIGN